MGQGQNLLQAMNQPGPAGHNNLIKNNGQQIMNL